MSDDSPIEFRKENVRDFEQLCSRTFRRWQDDPMGRFSSRQSNEGYLLTTLSFLISRLLKRAIAPGCPVYWVDAIELTSSVAADRGFVFTGNCTTMAIGDAGTVWLTPFQLKIAFLPEEIDYPKNVWLGYGTPDPQGGFNHVKPSNWRTWRTESRDLFAEWNNGEKGYALELCLDPYVSGEPTVAPQIATWRS